MIEIEIFKQGQSMTIDNVHVYGKLELSDISA